MRERGTLLVLFTALVSGFAIFVNKFGVTGINSSIYTFMKNVVVALFLLCVLLFFKEIRTLRSMAPRQWLLLMLIGLVGGSVPFLLYFRGLQLTLSSSASFIHKSMFVYVILFAALFLRERINKRIIFSGLLLLLGNALFLKASWISFNRGDVLILLATLCWATENVISKYALRQLPARVVGFGRMGFGSMFILGFLVATGQIGTIATVTAAQLGWVLITSLFLCLYVLSWYSGLKELRVSTATTILLLGAPITTALNFFFTGVSISGLQAIGMLLLLAGIFGIIGYLQYYSTLAAQLRYILQNVRKGWG